MDRRLTWIFLVLLLVLAIGRGTVGSPRPLTLWEVWEMIAGK